MQLLMRRRTPQRLSFDLVPASLWGYWTFGALFLLLGAWSGRAIGRGVDLQCRRLAGGASCRYAEVSLVRGWDKPQTVALNGAVVRTVTRLLYAGQTVVVLTPQGELRLPLVGFGGGAKDSLVAELKALAAGPARPVAVHEDYRGLGLLLGGALAIGGIICLLAIETARVVFDRPTGRVRLAQRRWFATTRSTVDLARVRGVARQESSLDGASSFAVVLVLDDGSEVPLTRMPLFTGARADKVMSIISDWLA